MDWVPMTSRMGRRIALVVAVCAALPAMLLAILFARDADSTAAVGVERQLAGISRLYAEVIRSRLGAAETIVLTLTAGDVGYDGATLKRQVVNSSAFKSVVIVDRDGLLSGGVTTNRTDSQNSRIFSAYRRFFSLSDVAMKIPVRNRTCSLRVIAPTIRTCSGVMQTARERS